MVNDEADAVWEFEARALSARHKRFTITPEGLRELGEAGAHLILVSNGTFVALSTTLTPEHEATLGMEDHVSLEFVKAITDE